MLSVMETSREQLTEAHRALLRAEASPFIDYPRLGRWYPFAWAAWAAWLVTTIDLDPSSPLAQLALSLSPVVIAFLFLGWYARRHGALPRDGRAAPAPLRRLARVLWALAVVLVLVVVGADAVLGPVVSIPLAAVGAGAAIAWYEASYARIAARLRRELA
ncbi:hypothetical protein GCM10022215_12240 [Nocardioides fonticola]|uniref:Integral membrane protein n=2 Tax=Nocardioides fonticola TaxID=450363 RepID=A0ABP7XF30_9ACTN